MASQVGFGPRAVVWRPLLYSITSEIHTLLHILLDLQDLHIFLVTMVLPM